MPLLGASRSPLHSHPVTAAQRPAKPPPTATHAERQKELLVARLKLEASERARRQNGATAAWASVDQDLHVPRLDIGDLQVACIPARAKACKCHRVHALRRHGRVHVVTDACEQAGQPPSDSSRILASVSRESKSEAEHGSLGARAHSLQHVGSSRRKRMCSEQPFARVCMLWMFLALPGMFLASHACRPLSGDRKAVSHGLVPLFLVSAYRPPRLLLAVPDPNLQKKKH